MSYDRFVYVCIPTVIKGKRRTESKTGVYRTKAWSGILIDIRIGGGFHAQAFFLASRDWRSLASFLGFDTLFDSGAGQEVAVSVRPRPGGRVGSVGRIST